MSKEMQCLQFANDTYSLERFMSSEHAVHIGASKVLLATLADTRKTKFYEKNEGQIQESGDWPFDTIIVSASKISYTEDDGNWYYWWFEIPDGREFFFVPIEHSEAFDLQVSKKLDTRIGV